MRSISITSDEVRFVDDDGATCRLKGPAAERIASAYSYFRHISKGLPTCGICRWPTFPWDSVDDWGAHVECVDQMRAEMNDPAQFAADIDVALPEPDDPFDMAEPEPGMNPWNDMSESPLEPA